MKRVFIFVLDSLGIGAAPDAEKFGDKDANTLKRISKSKKFNIPNLIEMGISNIEGLEYFDETLNPTAAAFRLSEKSQGKDTTTGHWEMMGAVLDKPFPTYPEGFPKELLDEFSKRCGRGVICNKVGSGTDIIEKWGNEHIKTGSLIVYTSADSVFQIAAHDSVCSLNELYRCCEIAREILCGEHAVGRVIARPFTTENGKFVRTADRKDYSLAPPVKTVLDAAKENDLDVISVGKIYDIFAGKGITQRLATHCNKEGMQTALALSKKNFDGICFVNLVDFDMLYGHRQDIDGYAAALSEFDEFLPKFIKNLDKNDLLIITADHGCDPGDNSTDHTREFVPLLIYGSLVKGGSFGTRETFADIGKTVCDFLGISYNGEGKSLLPIILK